MRKHYTLAQDKLCVPDTDIWKFDKYLKNHGIKYAIGGKKWDNLLDYGQKPNNNNGSLIHLYYIKAEKCEILTILLSNEYVYITENNLYYKILNSIICRLEHMLISS